MQFAFVHDGRVQLAADAVTAALKGADGKPLFDIRDVSRVAGIDLGWLANPDGSFSAPPVAAPSVGDLLAYAAARRFAVEVGGIAVNGLRVATDRGSQSMVANTYAGIQAHAGMQPPSAPSIRFKAASGWIELTADQFKAVALAVFAHVQACFAAEDACDAAINASPPTITTTAQIDAAPWPANA